MNRNFPRSSSKSGARHLNSVIPRRQARQIELAGSICFRRTRFSRRGCAHSYTGCRYRRTGGVRNGSSDLSQPVEWSSVVLDIEIDGTVGRSRLGTADDALIPNLEISDHIIAAIELPVRTRTAHDVVRSILIPANWLDAKVGSPCVANVVPIGAFQLLENFRQIASLRILLVRIAQLPGQPGDLRHKAGLVAASVLRIFRHGHGSAEFRLKLVRVHHFSGGEQCARRAVPLFELRMLDRLDNLRHTDGMDLVTRLHHFLFQIKEDLGETRLLFRERKDRLIHHLQAESRMHTFTAGVSNAEADASFAPRLVNRRIRRCFNLEFVRRLHEDEPMIAHGPGVPAEEISIEVHRSREFGRRRKRKFSVSIYDVEITR